MRSEPIGTSCRRPEPGSCSTDVNITTMAESEPAGSAESDPNATTQQEGEH
jgi:hypothetical protein